MNILFISAVLPYPLYSGGQVRIYNLLKRLSKRHTITLLSFIRGEKEREYAKNLHFLKNVHMVYRGRALQPKYLVRAFGLYPVNVERYPLLLETYNNEEMKNRIKQELTDRSYDLVHIEPFYVYPSVPDLSVPLVVGEHNIEYEVYDTYARTFPVSMLRPLMVRDAGRIRFWEEKVWQQARAVTVVSRSDAVVVSRYRKEPAQIVPNGVDTGLFHFTHHAFDALRPTVLFVGNFAWVPNVEAVSTLLKTIWPAIVKKYPNAHLTIIGSRFPDNLRPYISSNVSLKSNVEDIKKEYAGADILLAPLGIGGGSKYKILEAMGMGTIVITTKAGHGGIDSSPGIHVLEAETTEDFVRAVGKVYSSAAGVQKIAQSARKLIEDKYDWDIISEKLDSVWKKAV